VNGLLIPAYAGSDSLVLPRAAVNLRGSDGTEHALSFQDLAKFGMLPGISGGARGTNTAGDIVTQTVDGVDLNDLWDEFIASVDLQNADRQRIIDLLSFPVTQLIENVAQFATEDFEEATEFGVPKGIRTTQSVFQMAYTFKWYDIAARFTWKFLADADEAQVRAINSTVFDADNRLIFKEVMKTLFNSANLAATIKGQNYTVFKLYNADGTVPPPYKTNTFDGTHTHYLTSGAATVDSATWTPCTITWRITVTTWRTAPRCSSWRTRRKRPPSGRSESRLARRTTSCRQRVSRDSTSRRTCSW
jgi:hypothetical protein